MVPVGVPESGAPAGGKAPRTRHPTQALFWKSALRSYHEHQRRELHTQGQTQSRAARRFNQEI